MKKITLIIILLFTIKNFGQIDGPIVLGAIMADHVAESEQLDKISDKQRSIALFKSAITAENAKLIELEDKLYKGVSKLDDALINIKVVMSIGETGSLITKYLDEISKKAQGNPDLIVFVTAKKYKIIAESASIIKDTYIATKESTKSLMNSKERYDVLLLINENIEDLLKRVRELYSFVDSVQNLKLLDVVQETIQLNVDEIYKNLENDYESIFPESLRN